MTHAGASIPTMRLSVRAADAKVELAAQSVIRMCIERFGLSEAPLPIPIDDWIERPLGYRFSVASEEEMGAGVLGIARRAEREILVSETLLGNEGRYRFTCAHELGHMTLHTAGADWYRDEVMRHPAGAPEVEREADRFAAAMLMPIDLLPGAFAGVALEKRLHPSCFDMLRGDDVRVVWLWRRCFIPALAERFAVSGQAMVYRCPQLKELGDALDTGTLDMIWTAQYKGVGPKISGKVEARMTKQVVVDAIGGLIAEQRDGRAPVFRQEDRDEVARKCRWNGYWCVALRSQRDPRSCVLPIGPQMPGAESFMEGPLAHHRVPGPVLVEDPSLTFFPVIRLYDCVAQPLGRLAS